MQLALSCNDVNIVNTVKTSMMTMNLTTANNAYNYFIEYGSFQWLAENSNIRENKHITVNAVIISITERLSKSVHKGNIFEAYAHFAVVDVGGGSGG